MTLTAARLSLDGYDELRTCFAAHFGVNDSQVLLASPDRVFVSTLGGNLEGTANFNDCGALCTEVLLSFPNANFTCIVEDDIGGF